AQTQDNGADLLGGDALLAGEGEQAQTGAGAAKANLGQFAARLMGGLRHLQTTQGDEAEGVQNLQTGNDAFLQALARKVEGLGVEAKAVESFASARAAATAVAALDGTQGTAKAEAVQTANAVQNATPVGATGVSHGHQSAATSASGEVRSTANLPPAEQVAVQIQRAMQTGKSRITVELDPAELGKVEVRLDIDRRGQVMASVVAERPDTLDMLQKDARSLEKALASAGLSADMANLNFSLREGPKEQGHQQASKSGRGSGRDANNEDDAAKAAIGEVATAFDRGRRVSLDRALDVIV
ncbi:MAG: hypothetical protein FJX47_06920, partial [Alphaproteobacteria bacterium]|nr:hypothetical protein [Alphaproteobacteria bacterium]